MSTGTTMRLNDRKKSMVTKDGARVATAALQYHLTVLKSQPPKSTYFLMVFFLLSDRMYLNATHPIITRIIAASYTHNVTVKVARPHPLTTPKNYGSLIIPSPCIKTACFMCRTSYTMDSHFSVLLQYW